MLHTLRLHLSIDGYMALSATSKSGPRARRNSPNLRVGAGLHPRSYDPGLRCFPDARISISLNLAIDLRAVLVAALDVIGGRCAGHRCASVQVLRFNQKTVIG